MRFYLPLMAIVFTAPTSAFSQQIIEYTADIPVSSTNWASTMTLPKWDGSLGTLTGISFYLEGDVEGTARAENLESNPARLNVDLGATITLSDPFNDPLVVVVPLVNESFNARGFDGTVDFDGDSGVTYLDQVANDFISTAPTLNAGLISVFVGTGDVTLNLNAVAISSTSGSGNIVSSFSTAAGSTARVIYHYEPIPEPSSMATLGLAAGAVYLRRRRK